MILAPLSHASRVPSGRVTPAADRVLTARRDWASSPTGYQWRIALSAMESLASLPDGSVAVVAPWPPNPGDGTYYPPEDSSIGRDPPPLPANDPYRYSADPDGSMASEEALHDVWPFDPRYPEEYLPDPWAVGDPSDTDDPVNANSGPPPTTDTSDPVEPSDNEPVPETDPLDAVYNAEDTRTDQVVALIERPHATDALGRAIPARLVITAPEIVELRFAPVLTAAFPFTASARLTFNPDALP